jgi:glucose-6-phosphate dehydrogenase assembly protein OpcA
VEAAVTTTLNPERVLRDLAGLWASFGKPGAAEDGEAHASVLRACTMTLVVAEEDDRDWPGLGETIAALMPEHPARAILIRLTGAGERAMSGRVFSQCWMPFGQHRQICCERVEIAVSDAALADLPSVVRPLAVADLPLVFWCRSPRLAGMPEFEALAALARRTIVDSQGLPLAGVARLAAGPTLVGDLAWTRITRWRQTLSQVFENRQNLARVGALTDLSVAYAGPMANTALYMAAWISNALPGLRVALAPDSSCDSLRVALSGGGFGVELLRRQDRLVVTIDGLSQCSNLPLLDDQSQMREELGMVRRDPVFDAALARATQLAYPSG